jgi:hypothetical protein
VLPVITIFVDQDVLANSAGLDAAQILARSPGSLGFYREARDTPSCGVFFEGYDRAELDALIDTADAGTPTSGAPAEFIGEWYAHGAQLTIHDVGGVQTYGSTCGAAAEEWCNDIEQFTYTVDGSTLNAAISAVTVTDTQGTDRAAEYPPFHDVGYEFTLELYAPHVLVEAPVNDPSIGPTYWCQEGVSPEDAFNCGQKSSLVTGAVTRNGRASGETPGWLPADVRRAFEEACGVENFGAFAGGGRGVPRHRSGAGDGNRTRTVSLAGWGSSCSKPC